MTIYYYGRRADGTPVRGRSLGTPAATAKAHYDAGYTTLEIVDEPAGVQLGGIGTNPDTGLRYWYGLDNDDDHDRPTTSTTPLDPEHSHVIARLQGARADLDAKLGRS